ncbi:M20/M25/M40 family metallo-hydrolase [Infirmifilum lucidum]|uniref:M20/M25/M40 family metallo-hydrolase n=1 Tax=Infirmifilum lucidum TaxID=2776706 RepID=A0A7L9FH04_9CREN|nr:M20/M25/M40 family metallo-hydrolase [Infirmifilum lucidum]QOJ78293.1 M20/M25/M40 family metallo-hydrolase [Infirmifilum lucidum]
MFDPTYAYKLTLKLAREHRFTGSRGEEEARKIISEEFTEHGYIPTLEEFNVKVYEIRRLELHVTSPFRAEIQASPIGFSGETSGVEGRLAYIENSDKMLLPEEGGWIGLAVGRPSAENWKLLAKRASGLIVAESTPYRTLSRVAVPWEWRERYGSLPAVYVSYRDAVRLLDAERVFLALEQAYRDVTSYNIYAERSGYKYPDEIVLVTAHYDSVLGVPGATDNAGGVALLLTLAKSLSDQRLKRSVRFVLFGAEELGLRGSLAYIDRHKDELKNVVLVVNLDVHGGALGFSAAIVSGSKTLRNYVEFKAKEVGVNLSISEDVMSSDSTSFVWKGGVPAVNFYRSSGSGADIHTERDNAEHLHPVAFKVIGEFALKFLVDLLNSEELPFDREIPEEIKKKAEEYFKKRLALVDEKASA